MDTSKMTDEQLVRNLPMNAQTQLQTPYVLEMQRRLLVGIRDFNRQSGQQAATLIALTWAIVGLTVVLGIIVGLQLWAMLKAGA
jgi:hypothetical protein